VTAYTDQEIAAVARAANAELQALHGDPCPSLPGDAQDAEAHAVTVAGIRAILAGATPQQVHETWVRAREMQGWTHGPAKDSRLKTHPCLVPYRDLPEHQKVKDRVLRAIVLAMAGRDDAQEPGTAHDPDVVTAAARAQHAAYWMSFGYSQPPVPWEALDPAEVAARLAGAEAALGAAGLRGQRERADDAVADLKAAVVTEIREAADCDSYEGDQCPECNRHADVILAAVKRAGVTS
jgi:hypothetical protein